MRRLPALLLTLALAAVLAACSASAAPGWTYAPAASATPVPSGAASGEPSAGASSAPSVAPSAAESGAPSASAGESAGASGGTGATLTITAPSGAAGTGFDPKTLEGAANTAFTIHFDSQDTQPHNVQLKGASGEVTLGGDTAFFTGPGTRDYQVPALPAGDYTYYCVVHPTTMIGTLTLK